MIDPVVHPLATRGLRASPRFTLTLADRLSARERERLAPLMRDPEFFGILRDERGITELGATRDVALLFLTLSTSPGPLPAYAARAGDAAWRVVTQLVLDGVLEVEAAGVFVSGPAAVAELGATTSSTGRIATISRQALTDAVTIGLDTITDIEAHLYRYNRAPVTPDWSARVGRKAGVRTYLALDAGPVAARLNASWRSSTGATEEGWIYWAHREGSTTRGASGATYKVYVSPVLAELPRAVEAALPVLEAARVSAFKLGATAHALARADKMVCYFTSREHAVECGQLLATALSKTAVSDALIAIEAVSTSRISPTMIMFGACRNIARSAAAKVIPISVFTAT